MDHIFILSTDISDYFKMDHKNLKRNVDKLQREKYLDHVLKIERMVEVGKSATRKQAIYAFSRHQTEVLIMDFSGQ